jgi:acetyltransferase-like isoleucine patch superfamily enzyme
VSSDVRVDGTTHVLMSRGSTISIGPGVVLNSSTAKNTLEARGPIVLRTILPGAEISVGASTGMTSATLSCAARIVIGERVLIGSGVLITDSDHHDVGNSADEPRRFRAFPKPQESDAVRIGDDVFVGARSLILKGVQIGAGAVVGAGSVVTKDVAPGAIVAGNPAREIGRGH